MKLYLFASAAAMVILSSQAFAQGVIEIAPEQRTHIREYIVREHVPRTIVREGIEVGGTVPADVELREVPPEWGASVRPYRYYHSDRGLRFVDPQSRSVIYDYDMESALN
jgi:hypothetical protein